MKFSSKPRPHSGFTIIEFVVVMLIVGIIAAIGVPSFKYVTTSNRIASEINALLADMRYARTEAIRTGLPVTLCATTDNANCSSTTPAWQSGWMIFADPAGTRTLPAGALPLRTQAAFSTAYNNSTDVFVLSAAGFYAETFNRQGFGSAYITTTTANTSTTTMALRSVPENTSWTRCLDITVTGQLLIENTTAATGDCT
jgi:type IV fimbrial biogenesis protein FimT